MKRIMKELRVVVYIVLAGAVVTMLAVVCSASAVWGS
jgi:hypothetical protein